MNQFLILGFNRSSGIKKSYHPSAHIAIQVVV